MSNYKKIEITLEDLFTNSFRFLVETQFKIKLFDTAVERGGLIKNLAKELKCCRDTVRNMKTGRTKLIRWQIVKKLIEIARVPVKNLESHIIAISGGKSGKKTRLKLPIKESPELALLVAKGMGDGTIETKKMRFSYCNTEPALIKEVCESVNIAMGETRATITKLKDGLIQAKFSPFVGFALHFAGVPIGNKTLQSFDVPNWIVKNKDKKIKAAFLRGLFDDEGCVNYHKKSRTRRIVLALGKSREYEKSLFNFLDEICSILKEFEISVGDITLQEEYNGGCAKMMLRFGIYNKENIEKFGQKIGLTHPGKRQSLSIISDSYKNY